MESLAALLVVLIVLMSVILIVLVVGVLVYLRKLNEATEEMSRTLREVRLTFLPLADEARRAISETHLLAKGARKQVDRIDRILGSVDTGSIGRILVDAIRGLAGGSVGGPVSVVDKIWGAISSIRSRKREPKEDVNG